MKSSKHLRYWILIYGRVTIRGMKRISINVYVAGVSLAVIIVNLLSFLLRGAVQRGVVVFSAGFLVGILAMYIAIHLYRVEQ